MATGTVIAGKADVRIAGKIYNASSWTTTPGATQREILQGMRGPAGTKVTPVAPTMTGTIFVTADVSLADLNAIESETIEAQYADGRAYVMNGGCLAEPPAHDAQEGTAELSFQGLTCTEVL